MSTTLAPDTRDALLDELRRRTTTPGFHFLTSDHLTRLNETASDGAPVVSLYLSLSPEMRRGNAWEQAFREVSNQALGQAGKHTAAVQAELDRIRETLEGGLPRTGRGVAFFACESIGLFERLGTAIDLPTSVHVEQNPYVRPLARVRDENDRFVIVLVSAHQSRFFFAQIGLVEEVYTLDGEELAVTDTVSKDQRQDIRADLRRAQAQRSAHAATLICKTLDARHVVYSAPPDMDAAFTEALDQATRQKLAGHFACEIHASTAEVAAAAEAVQRETEAREEMETLARVEAQLSTRAVAGLADTLDMLNQQRVMTLVVDDEALVPGGLVSMDGAADLLTEQTGGTYAATGTAVRPVLDLVEHMLDRAMTQGASLEIVRSDDARAVLAKHGPAAAILRF
jgi:peptide subunit release factor 1 (eRF1)